MVVGLVILVLELVEVVLVVVVIEVANNGFKSKKFLYILMF